jgi:hypothetical protein
VLHFVYSFFVDRICGYRLLDESERGGFVTEKALRCAMLQEKMGGIGFGYPARILTRRRLNYGQLPGGWLKPENRFRVPMKV